MTSAFGPPQKLPPTKLLPTEHPTTTTTTSANTLESETEDEEVKVNCIGGYRGMEDDSDMNTLASYSSSDNDNVSEDDEEEEQLQLAALDRRRGVVSFISKCMLRPTYYNHRPRIVKPKASRLPALSPTMESWEEQHSMAQPPSSPAPWQEAFQQQQQHPYEDVFHDDDTVAEESQAQLEEQEELSVSGSDADESDMEEEELDEEEEEDGDNDQDDAMDYESQSTPPLSMTTTALLQPELHNAGVHKSESAASFPLDSLQEGEPDEPLSEFGDSARLEKPRFFPQEEQGEMSHPNYLGLSDSSVRGTTHLIGVAQDRCDNESVSVPRVKRVLSLDETTLSHQVETAKIRSTVPRKRRKSDAGECMFFSLGPPLSSPYDASSQSTRIVFMNNTNDLEEELLDGQLRYELESASSTGGEQSPVPLLTPPESPTMGETCEWPSNLAVDSAMTAIRGIQVSPL